MNPDVNPRNGTNSSTIGLAKLRAQVQTSKVTWDIHPTRLPRIAIYGM